MLYSKYNLRKAYIPSLYRAIVFFFFFLLQNDVFWGSKFCKRWKCGNGVSNVALIYWQYWSSISCILSQTPVKTKALSYQIPPRKMPGVELTSLSGIDLSKYLCNRFSCHWNHGIKKKNCNIFNGEIFCMLIWEGFLWKFWQNLLQI